MENSNLFFHILENTCMQNPCLTDKTIIFSENEVFKVFKNIFKNEKSPKNITFNQGRAG